MSVPRDLSLVSLADDNFFAEFEPPVTFYRTDSTNTSRQIAHRVMDLVDGGHVARESYLIPMDYIPGATVGEPPPRLVVGFADK